MLRLEGEQVEVLWDELLPAGVRLMPDDLAKLDVLLRDEALLRPIAELWRRAWPAALARGRPTIPTATYVRLMVVKQRHGWGYETLVRELVSRHDPDARPIRKGKLGKPNEFGCVAQPRRGHPQQAARRARLRTASRRQDRQPERGRPATRHRLRARPARA